MDRCTWGISGVSRETECAKVYKYIYKSCLLRKWVAFRGACCWLSRGVGEAVAQLHRGSLRLYFAFGK